MNCEKCVSLLTEDGKKLISKIVTNLDEKCRYCKYMVHELVCSKGNKSYDCEDFKLSSSIDTIDVCRLCKHSILKKTSNDVDDLHLFCNYDNTKPKLITPLSVGCNEFESKYEKPEE